MAEETFFSLFFQELKKICNAIFFFCTSRWMLLLLIFPAIWGMGTVWYNGGDLFSLGGKGRALLLTVYSLTVLFLWTGIFWKKLFALPLFLLELGLLLFYLSLTPERSFRDTLWQPSWKEEPKVEFLPGNRVRLHNVRDFIYRSEKEFTPRYITETLDLNELETLDLILSYWDDMEGIAHSMLSFGFSHGKYIVLSMETRLPVGVKQGFLPGLYKQFGLLMILGTEQDLLRLRTHFRKEELYLYRTNATREQAKKIFLAVLHGAGSLHKNPRYYNSITRNCTTSLAPLLRLVDPSLKRDIRLLFNGFSDEYLFELGYLKAREKETFPQLKKRRKVNLYAEKPGQEADAESYSARIRENL